MKKKEEIANSACFFVGKIRKKNKKKPRDHGMFEIFGRRRQEVSSILIPHVIVLYSTLLYESLRLFESTIQPLTPPFPPFF